MEFKSFSAAVATQFQSIQSAGLFQTAISGDELWRIYLESFPAGSNPIFKTRTEHDCTCCRRFIKTVGGAVALMGGKVVTIWDVAIGGHFQVVADALAAAVRAQPIENIFLHTEPVAGTASNQQLLEDKATVRTWHHFFVNLPRSVVVKGEQIGPKLSDARATRDVMKRGLEEIGLDSIGMVLELIAQNSLYRGEEHRFAVDEFRKMKLMYQPLCEADRELFVWAAMTVKDLPASVSRIRGTVIGTLLTDLSEGKDLEDAVKSFEAKVAPTNYKRPTALVTKAMIARAQETVNALGFATALERRYATIDDITINNLLFADRSVKKAMNVFADLAATKPETAAQFDKVETVSIDDFLGKILPTAQSVEVLFENRHIPNLVSLIAPADPTARSMFKWPNNFSWSYSGELADSIKERVKQAGGNVTGDFRASLSWHNYDDLDLHLAEPSGYEIYYAAKQSPKTGGTLDVDMNAGAGNTRNAVENIVYPHRRKMEPGTYKLFVHNFCARESVDGGFEVEIEFDGEMTAFAYPKLVRHGEAVLVAEFTYSHATGIKILKSLPSQQTSKTAWGIGTQAFHRVNVVMLSPNHWDEKAVGNRHYFFMLDGCRHEGKARGFFNEFLSSELDQHRKVLEVVGARMKTEESDRQLSGLGFSSTQRQQIVCRVTGSFSRVIKVLV